MEQILVKKILLGNTFRQRQYGNMGYMSETIWDRLQISFQILGKSDRNN